MKKSEDSWYRNPTRQSPIAIVMIVFNIVKSLIRVWWPIIILLFFRSSMIGPDTGKPLVIGAVIVIILFSIWRYLRFHFYLSESKLHVQSGVFTRTKMDIPFDRIQTISFEQNVIHQLFNVTKLKIDTAGSSKEEFEFAALEKAKAQDLRNFILSRRTNFDVDTGVATDHVPDQKLLLALEVSDLVKVGVSQNHLRTTGIILAFLLGLRDRIEEALGESYVDQFDSLAEQLFQNIFTWGIGLFVILLLASFIGTLFYTVFRYYDLRLWKTSEGYKVQAGLLNKIEQAAIDHKIQIVRWVSNPLRRIFGIVHLRFYQASSATGNRSINVTVPGYPEDKIYQIKKFAFGHKYIEPQVSHGIDRSFFWRRVLFLGMLPATLFCILGWLDQRLTWFVIGGLWFIIIGVFQHYYQKKWAYFLTDRECITSHGVFEIVNKAISMRKIQGVQIWQSPFQRRRNLSSIILHTASGDVKIPFIPYQVSLQIKNYILYKIESSRGKWM